MWSHLPTSVEAISSVERSTEEISALQPGGKPPSFAPPRGRFGEGVESIRVDCPAQSI
jgi:hypothetical protein